MLLRSLVGALRARHSGIPITLAAPRVPGWQPEEALEWSGLADVARASDVTVEGAPGQGGGAAGALTIALAPLAPHPRERLAGVLAQYWASAPDAWVSAER